MTSSKTDRISPVLTVGDSCHGFEITEAIPLPHLDGIYYALEHINTCLLYTSDAADDYLTV